jgi:hypothetical protein
MSSPGSPPSLKLRRALVGAFSPLVIARRVGAEAIQFGAVLCLAKSVDVNEIVVRPTRTRH